MRLPGTDMKIKTFEAPSLEEAYQRIRQELDGYSTSVLSTRTLAKGGIMGLFTRPVVQVTVAVDETSPVAAAALSVPVPVKDPDPAVPPVPVQEEGPEEEESDPQPKTHSNSRMRLPRPAERSKRGRSRLKDQLRTAESKTPDDLDMDKLRAASSRVAPQALIELHGYLLRQEVDEDLAEYIVRTIAKRLDDRDLNNKTLVMKALEESITRIINVSGPIELVDKNLKIIAFVGPTGVGKTTTIAKLAADFTFLQRKKVTLITLDTFRIAAVEQLRTYANIMNIPVEVAHNPQELKIKVKEHADSDLIMIDTPGRSPKDDLYISELKGYMDAIAPVEVHLVLSAGTRHREICSIVEKYGPINAGRLVLTKVDEVFKFGSIINIKDMITLPISYVTNGQNVPRDIDVADAARLARLVTGRGEN